MNENVIPKVSIIVPMYNVGDYAAACIESLISQTYTNIEIIIVDDGSTDNTNEVCRYFAKNDKRVHLFKKKNGGLSSARNFGLSYASGDYLTFVDGDDILVNWAISHLVKAARELKVPLVTCRHKKIRSVADFSLNEDGYYHMVSNELLLKMLLLLDGESGSAWAKLYSKDLIPLLHFPEGRLFEDFGVEAKLIASIDSAGVSSAEAYGYMVRPGSITSEKKYSNLHIESMEDSLNDVKVAVGQFAGLEEAYKCFEGFCSLRIAQKLDVDSCEDPNAALEYIHLAQERCNRASRSHLPRFIWRVRCRIYSLSPSLHNMAYQTYGLLTGKIIA